MPLTRIATILLIVAPFAGAWIEISVFNLQCFVSFVAPFAGAWIEIRVLHGQAK